MNTQPPVIDLPEETQPADFSNFRVAELPRLVSRIKATFIDFLILLFVFAVSSVVIDAVGGAPSFVRGAILIFMVYVYDPLLTCLYGGTIGHRILGLRVARYDYPEQRISIIRSSVRFIIKYTLGWISLFTVTASDEKRAIHDFASGSILLYRKP
jgi:uncharacterized RDD family membrane protein YckC